MTAALFLAALPLFFPGDKVDLSEGQKRIFDDCGALVLETDKTALEHSEIQGRLGAFQCVAGDATNWFAYLPSRTVAPCAWVGTGTHASHGWRQGDARLVEAMAMAGIGTVRVETNWENSEKEKGVFRPLQGLDQFINDLTGRGISVNLLLTYGNRIYENPLDPEAFSAFCAWTAGRYKGIVERYEVWNEPQNFWFPKAYGNEQWLDKFIELTSTAKSAIRKANPSASVGVAAEDVESLLDAMIVKGIAGEEDVIAFHPYCHRQHRPEREYFLKDFGAKHRVLAKQHGGATRFAITEAGWSTFQGKGVFWQVAGSYPRASYAGQANCIVRFFLAARAAGVEFACQYDFKDDGSRQDHAEHNFGLMFKDFSPKPAYAAVATLTRMVGVADYEGEMESDPSRCRVMRFVQESKTTLACWSIEGECEWLVPEPFHGAEMFDLYGNSLGRLESDTITLTERPFYIVLETAGQ